MVNCTNDEINNLIGDENKYLTGTPDTNPFNKYINPNIGTNVTFSL